MSDSTSRRRTVLIAGASRGIGRATVDAFSAAGWRVVAGVRDPATVFDGDDVHVVTFDVTDHEAVRAAVGRAQDLAGGALDAVVSNAGHAVMAPVEYLDMDVVREAFEVNTFGAVALAQAALPAMREAGGGRIVFVTTVGVHLTTPIIGAYRGAKAALSAMAEVLAGEVRGFGIRVSCVEPGMVATEFSQATRRSPRLAAETDGPYSRIFQQFAGGFARWREWINVPPQETAADILAVVEDPDPPVFVLSGDDARHLASLDPPEFRAFMGLDA